MCQLGQEDEPAAEDEEDSMETESGPPTTTMKSFKDAIAGEEEAILYWSGWENFLMQAMHV